MTTTTATDQQALTLTLGEAKHLCFTLSYMQKSVRNGIKKTADNKKAYKEQYSRYVDCKANIVDQLKDINGDMADNTIIELYVTADHKQLIQQFVSRQIDLFTDLLHKGQDNLLDKAQQHIVPLQTIMYKLL